MKRRWTARFGCRRCRSRLACDARAPSVVRLVFPTLPRALGLCCPCTSTRATRSLLGQRIASVCPTRATIAPSLSCASRASRASPPQASSSSSPSMEIHLTSISATQPRFGCCAFIHSFIPTTTRQQIPVNSTTLPSFIPHSPPRSSVPAIHVHYVPSWYSTRVSSRQIYKQTASQPCMQHACMHALYLHVCMSWEIELEDLHTYSTSEYEYYDILASTRVALTPKFNNCARHACSHTTHSGGTRVRTIGFVWALIRQVSSSRLPSST